MKNKSRAGFTLIELVVVIVILGILMAVAIPKYVDITSQAKRAADRGQLAGLRSSTHTLYAQAILTNAVGTSAWPAAANVWANMQSTNAWQWYGVGDQISNTVSYTQTSGVWAVAGYPNE